MSYELREYRPGDELGILATFERVFRPAGSERPPRTLAEWRWAFEQNPAGRRIYLAVAGEEVCAQSAGWPFATRLDGRETCFTLSVDSLVHPEHARGLRNPGLFVRTVNAYDDDYGGRLDLVHFGWPNRESMRIGRKFLHYDVVREQTLLAHELSPGPSDAPAGVEWTERCAPDVRALWTRCAAAWGASTVRDAPFFDWRFTTHPTRRYEFLRARGASGELLGQVVCRLADWPRPDLFWIVDWLVPDAERALGEPLLTAVAARARARRAVAVGAFFPDWSPWNDAFLATGFRSFRDDCHLTVRSYDPAHDTAWLREHWWVQPGEMDTL